MSDLALLDELSHSLHLLLYRAELALVGDQLVSAVGPGLVHGPSEEGHVTLWPMDLIEVNAVCLQAPQRCCTGIRDLLSGERRCCELRLLGVAVPTDPVPGPGAGDLGGEEYLLAPLRIRCEPSANVGLRAPDDSGIWWHGVHLCGVDEGAAAAQEVVQLRVRLRLGVLDSPGHGPKATLRDLHLPSKHHLLHGGGTCCPRCRVGCGILRLGTALHTHGAA
mmetsp:Transcript_38447/g.86676  ORF Transcript_38447/g.86676 Transcript_38447/m.86676 type:complete len:221 (+) Transcript_38447:681-1343(+)